jgi:hypothetical protein
MDQDNELRGLREIGERNRVTLTLLKNWCAHAEVVSEGSGGLFQEVTGLPIAMCRVACIHERAAASISMHLDANALDFHDRNCIDCDKRIPVKFPNLSYLVGERDRKRENGMLAAANRQRTERALLEARTIERSQVFEKPTSAQNSLLTLLDLLDREPNEETEREFAFGMRSVGRVANARFVEAVIAVMQAGGSHRVRGALLALEAAEYDSVSLGTFALEALSRNEAVETAARLAIDHMTHLHHDQIQKAGPRLLQLAGRTVSLPFEGDGVICPEALKVAYKIAPDIVQKVIESALASEAKEWRRTGCFAIEALIQEELEFDVVSITRALVESFRLPDDIYLDGPAYGAVACLLAQMAHRFQDPVEAVLGANEEDRDERVRAGVFRAYTEVFRRRDLSTGEIVTESVATEQSAAAVEARALERIVAIISILAEDERLGLAIDFLRSGADRIVTLQGATSATPVLLGIAAIACERSDAANKASSVILDPRPEPLRELDFEEAALQLASLASEILDLVTNLACKHPDAAFRSETVRLLLETLQALPSHADRFRAKLVKQLGKLYGDHSLRGTLLPEIYSAMTHVSVRVRSAATLAYADVCSHVSPEVLPSLLHESFLVQLGDPYVAVHKVALRCLRQIGLPEVYRHSAFELVANLVSAYQNEPGRRDEFFLADALSRLLKLAPEKPSLTEAVKRYVVDVARSLSLEALYHFLRESARILYATPGIGELVLTLPFRTRMLDYRSEFVLKTLRALPREEVRRVSDRLIEVGVTAARRNPLTAFPLLELLDRHGESKGAHSLAMAAVEASGSERSQLPGRLRMSVYSKALEIENALNEGTLEDLASLMAELRRLETEIAEDDRLNHERRSRDVFY